jgi:phosphatidylserine decarboxylase
MKQLANDVFVIDRQNKTLIHEPVFGHRVMQWLFGQKQENKSSWLSQQIAYAHWLHWLVGKLTRTSLSRFLIKSFIINHRVKIDHFLKPPRGWNSFEDFFSRSLNPIFRPINQEVDTAVMPADGRYRFFKILNEKSQLTIKNRAWDLKELAGDQALKYQGAKGCLVRLCPSDYHRFHCPIDGKITRLETIPGPLFSVHPWSLAQNFNKLIINHRVVIEILHPHFGYCLMTIIGATFVGSITLKVSLGQQIKKGQELGSFHFGGSAIMIFFENTSWSFTQDLSEAFNLYQEKHEVLGQMGESLAQHKPNQNS